MKTICQLLCYTSVYLYSNSTIKGVFHLHSLSNPNLTGLPKVLNHFLVCFLLQIAQNLITERDGKIFKSWNNRKKKSPF